MKQAVGLTPTRESSRTPSVFYQEAFHAAQSSPNLTGVLLEVNPVTTAVVHDVKRPGVAMLHGGTTQPPNRVLDAVIHFGTAQFDVAAHFRGVPIIRIEPRCGAIFVLLMDGHHGLGHVNNLHAFFQRTADDPIVPGEAPNRERRDRGPGVPPKHEVVDAPW